MARVTGAVLSQRLLIFGIGNPLRGDDGVGPWLASRVGGRCVQQLTPELAPVLLGLDRVLFIDAALGERRPRLETVNAGGEAMLVPPHLSLSHGLTPQALVGLCRQLYGAAPQATVLLLPGLAFDHGNRWSTTLRRQLPAARHLLQQWLAAHA